MTSPSAKLVRFATGVTITVLAAAAVQAAPAAAAPTEALHPAVSISARVLYPPDDATPGLPGTSEDAPADAGPAPGLLSVLVTVANVGTEPLGDFHFYDRQVTNGVQDGFQCDLDPSSPGISEPGFALEPGRSFTCTETYSEITQGSLHKSSRYVAASGLSTQEGVTESAQVWAEAGPPVPQTTPPPPVSIGHRVWLDTNRNQQWDAGEPGIPGVRVWLRLAAFEPQPDNGFQSDETTTDKDGTYRFDDVEPGVRYSVLVDLRAPGLKDTWLMSPPFSNGGGGDDNTVYADTSRSVYTYDAMNFGFVPKARMVFDIDVSAKAAAGTTIDVQGRLYRPDMPEEWGGYTAWLEFRAGGTNTWAKVADAVELYDQGKKVVRLKVTRSGWFRYRSGGSEYVAPAVSREAHVVVVTTPVALTATAPTTVPPQGAFTVTGTITRAGMPFKTGRITLEHSPDGTTWTTPTDVRSTDGTLTATVRTARAGSYRFRYAGDSTTAPGTSPAQHVTLSPSGRKSPPRHSHSR